MKKSQRFARLALALLPALGCNQAPGLESGGETESSSGEGSSGTGETSTTDESDVTTGESATATTASSGDDGSGGSSDTSDQDCVGECGPAEVCIDTECVLADGGVLYEVRIAGWVGEDCGSAHIVHRFEWGDGEPRAQTEPTGSDCPQSLGHDYPFEEGVAQILVSPEMRIQNPFTVDRLQAFVDYLGQDPEELGYLLATTYYWPDGGPGIGPMPTNEEIATGLVTLVTSDGLLRTSWTPIALED